MSSSKESSPNSDAGARDGLQSSPKHRLEALPAELLKLIILLVKEQDERLEIVAHTVFSPPWRTIVRGNGLSALSSTSRRLREAALPFMREVVRPRQLTHPLFQLGALPPALLSGVRKVNCSAIKRETLASLVAGLSVLPNLEAIDISNDTMLSLTRPRSSAEVAGYGTARELAEVPSEVIKNAFRRFRSRWRSVTYLYASESRMERQLEPFWDPASIIRLELFEFTLAGASPQPRLAALSQYRHLTSLSLCFCGNEISLVTDVPSVVQLPALRSFEIGGYYPEVIPLAQQMAPNVVDLRINFRRSDFDAPPVALHLPRLRRLTVEMAWPAATLLYAFTKCELQSLNWIEYGHEDEIYVDSGQTPAAFAVPLVSELPASLRTITFEPDDGRLYQGMDNGWSDDDIAALAAKCASRGVTFDVKPYSRVRTGYRVFTEKPLSWASNAEEVCEKKGASLRDLLGWATRRVRWLEQTGDIAGMREMVEMLTELKQRQVLEEA
ncbi:hypothetical protein JCM10049v2_004732 [Rhodotorula toruloides]